MLVYILGSEVEFKDLWHYINFFTRINNDLEASRMLNGLAQQEASEQLYREREKYQEYLAEIEAKYPPDVIKAIQNELKK